MTKKEFDEKWQQKVLADLSQQQNVIPYERVRKYLKENAQELLTDIHLVAEETKKVLNAKEIVSDLVEFGMDRRERMKVGASIAPKWLPDLETYDSGWFKPINQYQTNNERAY